MSKAAHSSSSMTTSPCDDLKSAVINNDIDKINTLLSDPAQAKQLLEATKYDREETPLLLAARVASVETIKIIMNTIEKLFGREGLKAKLTSSTNEFGSGGMNSFKLACGRNDGAAAAKLLLETFSTLGGKKLVKEQLADDAIASEYTPLRVACASEDVSCRRDYYNDVDEEPSSRVEIVKLLLEAISSYGEQFIRDQFFQREYESDRPECNGPLIIACEKSSAEVVTLLLNTIKNVGGNTKFLRKQLAVRSQCYGHTPLTTATYDDRPDIVRVLLSTIKEQGADFFKLQMSIKDGGMTQAPPLLHIYSHVGPFPPNTLELTKLYLTTIKEFCGDQYLKTQLGATSGDGNTLLMQFAQKADEACFDYVISVMKSLPDGENFVNMQLTRTNYEGYDCYEFIEQNPRFSKRKPTQLPTKKSNKGNNSKKGKTNSKRGAPASGGLSEEEAMRRAQALSSFSSGFERHHHRGFPVGDKHDEAMKILQDLVSDSTVSDHARYCAQKLMMNDFDDYDDDDDDDYYN